MTIDPEIILNADGTTHSAVLLSDATRFVLVTALHEIREREAWDGMTDGEWDDLEKIIGQAAFEIEDEKMGIGARLERTTTLVIPASTNVHVDWNDPQASGRTYDTDGFWAAANPERLTIPAGQAGLYIIGAGVEMQSAGGDTVAQLLVGGNVLAEREFFPQFKSVTFTTQYQFDEGDFIRLRLNSPLATGLQSTISSPFLVIARIL